MDLLLIYMHHEQVLYNCGKNIKYCGFHRRCEWKWSIRYKIGLGVSIYVLIELGIHCMKYMSFGSCVRNILRKCFHFSFPIIYFLSLKKVDKCNLLFFLSLNI